jgi:hypothetical protein
MRNLPLKKILVYCMIYIIKRYSFDRAKEFGVDIKQSTSKNKKIDVFKNGVKIAIVGDDCTTSIVLFK